jgi:hypothetical protein
LSTRQRFWDGAAVTDEDYDIVWSAIAVSDRQDCAIASASRGHLDVAGEWIQLRPALHPDFSAYIHRVIDAGFPL